MHDTAWRALMQHAKRKGMLATGGRAAAGAPPLGEGGRFKALSAKIAKRKGVRNPDAIAAAIGRAKYGGKKMATMAAKGRARA